MSRVKKVSIAALLLLVAAILAWYVLQPKFEFDSDAENGTLEGLTQAQIQEAMDKKVEESMFAISISSSPQFDSKTKKGIVNIENAPNNHYIMVVEIERDDTQEVIYRSKGIKPGQMVKEASLDKELSKGEYACTATFIAVETTNYQEIGKTAAKINVTVK